MACRGSNVEESRRGLVRAPAAVDCQPPATQRLGHQAQGPVGAQVAAWAWDEMLTIEDKTAAVARYPVALDADEYRLREVGEPPFFAIGRASPPPFRSPLEVTERQPARRVTRGPAPAAA